MRFAFSDDIVPAGLPLQTENTVTKDNLKDNIIIIEGTAFLPPQGGLLYGLRIVTTGATVPFHFQIWREINSTWNNLTLVADVEITPGPVVGIQEVSFQNFQSKKIT